jgi:hypothetical protein
MTDNPWTNQTIQTSWCQVKVLTIVPSDLASYQGYFYSRHQ